MKGKVLLGAILIVIGFILFLFDITRMTSILLYILTIMAVVSPFFAGKKIAAYLHDSRIARERGFRANPQSLIYLWLFFWLIFVLLYTVFTIILSDAIKYVVSTIKADYLGLIYTIFIFFGSFYIFSGSYSTREDFITMWGRALERSRRIGKNVAGEIVEKTKSFEKYL